jgi:hypothetical protein
LQIFDNPKGKNKIYKSTMQQSRHHYVALYLEETYEMLALEAHFDVKRQDIPTFSNRPSFQCKFCKIMFKDKNTLSYHRMMNLCLEYIGKELLKMYPTITKSKAKELIRLGEKHGKTLPNCLKRPNEDAKEYSPKRTTPPKNQKQPMEMPPVRLGLPKEKEIYELSNDEEFSSIGTANEGEVNC